LQWNLQGEGEKKPDLYGAGTRNGSMLFAATECTGQADASAGMTEEENCVRLRTKNDENIHITRLQCVV
jgi:hypothetical protein